MSFLTIQGFGGGAGGAAVASKLLLKPAFTIKRYDTSNSLQSTTPYSDVTSGTKYTLTDAGYYTLEIEPNSPSIEFQMWAWGGGGGTANDGNNLSRGGAGGGVRGTSTFDAGDTITFLVGGGGGYQATSNQISTSFPDGGSTLDDGYIEGPGGGRSSIYDGLLPYANRDATPNTFLLIGGGGGGGSDTSNSGTLDARAGYPSGFSGGGYYPTDGGGATGKGGTQTAGGAAGSGGRQPGSTAGSKYAGGPGAGGAGGGGYYGGGGAMGYYAMGGGGSGYIHPTLTDTASFTGSPGIPTHYISVDDPANPGTKPAPAGYSGYGGSPNGGQDGVVVFKVL